jgi:hypothetical protein
MPPDSVSSAGTPPALLPASAPMCRNDGLAGRLGLQEVHVDGQVKFLTPAEVDALGVAPTGPRPVVHNDNHRQLARESIEQARGQSVTEAVVDAESPRLVAPPAGGLQGLLQGQDALRRSFESRVALQGQHSTRLAHFDPPGWRPGDVDACFELAHAGVAQTTAGADTPVGGGGVILYESQSQRFRTDATASRVALDQIKAHVDAGKAVLAGVSEPAHGGVVNAASQPVTDHFVAIDGYEADASGRITALLGKDNAVSTVGEVRFVVAADGSITKPAEKRADGASYLEQEYQLSEVRFHTSMAYAGSDKPTNDAGQSMIW